MGRLSAPEPLTQAHGVTGFDCGIDSLNDWLLRRALKNEGAGGSRTYVVCHRQRVAGYYAVASGSITRQAATGPLRRNMPEPIPAIVLGQLAVDTRWKGQGVGRGLLKDALLRALNVSRQVGVRVLLVHALDESAAAFYRRHGFVASPLNPHTLMLPLT